MAESEKPKREQKAKHWLVDSQGEKTSQMAEAVGVGYEDVATGETVVHRLIPEGEDSIIVGVGHPALMFGLFGAKTLATNEASQVRQAVKRGDDVDGSEVDGILARFALIDQGTWREVSEGPVGRKVDRDKLAAAIVEAQAALGNDRDLAEIRQRLDDDTKFFRNARKAEDVRAIYDRLMGRESKPIDSSDLFE